MKTFFIELLQYNNHYNQELISVLEENPGKASEKCMTLLSHILNAHQVWNYNFQPDQLPYNTWEVHQIKDFREMDKKNFEDSILCLISLN